MELTVGHDDNEVWRSELPFHPGDDHAALAPHWPTPVKSVQEGCDLANIGPEDIVYDIGCGEGICICEIASYTSATCFGVELDAELASTARRNVIEMNLQSQVQILQQDGRQVDLSNATCIWVFLVPSGLSEISEQLLGVIERGGRVISYTFQLPIKDKYLKATGANGNLFIYSN